MCTLLELTFQLKSDTSCQCNEIKFRIDILQCYFETSHAKESWDGQTRLGHCKNCFPGLCEVSTTTLSPCCFPLVSAPSCLQSFLALLAERGPCFWCAVGVWYLMPWWGRESALYHLGLQSATRPVYRPTAWAHLWYMVGGKMFWLQILKCSWSYSHFCCIWKRNRQVVGGSHWPAA